jgi:uncharacterized protein
MTDMSSVNFTTDEEVPVRVIEKPKKSSPERNLVNSVQDLVSQERFWAATAHAISPIMIAMLFFGDSIAWLGLIFITAGIYFYYADKSPRIKMHARQALVAQLIGTVGWFAILMSGIAVWVVLLIISAVLILLLVGILLFPMVFLAGLLLMLASFVMPLGTALFGVIGAWEAWNERDYRYPRLADWLDRRFGSINAITTV